MERESESSHFLLSLELTLLSAASTAALLPKAVEPTTRVGVTKTPDATIELTPGCTADQRIYERGRQHRLQALFSFLQQSSHEYEVFHFKATSFSRIPLFSLRRGGWLQ